MSFFVQLGLIALLIILTFIFYKKYKKDYASIIYTNIFLMIVITYNDYILFGGRLLPPLIYDYSIILLASILLIKINKHIKNIYIINFLIYLIVLSLVIFPLIYFIYYLLFDAAISAGDFFAIYQSNVNEVFGYIEQFIPLYSFIPVVLVLIFIVILTKKITNNAFYTKIDFFLIGKSILLILLLLLIPRGYAAYSYAYLTYTEYNTTMKLFKEMDQKIQKNNLLYADKNESDELHIIIIGESLNKHHMSLYGYKRATTPLLDSEKDDLIVFTNTYSNHVETMASLSYALTEANQLNGMSFYNSISLLDIYNKAGFHTTWLTNQRIYGINDNLIGILAKKASNLIQLNTDIGEMKSNKNYYDGEILKYLKQILVKVDGQNNVIFVHLFGSHAPYKRRYTDEFNKFNASTLNKLKERLHLIKEKQNTKNHYDNSVYYNDWVVYNILKLLKETISEKKVATLTYFSDHGEDVIHSKGHSRSLFTYDMTQIPFIFWSSNAYRKKYPKKVELLKNRVDSLYCNDMIYDTLIGISHIYTDKYNPKYDLSNKNFSFNDDEAYTLHNGISYQNKENIFYKEPISDSTKIDIFKR